MTSFINLECHLNCNSKGHNNTYSVIHSTAHLLCDDHSTSISVCGVWGVRARVQVYKGEFHAHIHLDFVRLEFYFVSKKKKKHLLIN